MMNEREKAMVIDRVCAISSFSDHMDRICREYHHDNMTIRERVQEEIKAIKEHLRAMELLVVNRE